MMTSYKAVVPRELLHSRNVLLFNIGADKLWNSTAISVKDDVGNRLVSRIEEIGLLLAESESIVILRRQPDEFLVNTFNALGTFCKEILAPREYDETKTITQLVLRDESLLSYLRTLSNYSLVPYAVTTYEEELAQKCNMKLVGPSSPLCCQINDKIHARSISKNLGFTTCRGTICRYSNVENCAMKLLEDGVKKLVLKDRYGVSGNGMHFINNYSDLHRVRRIMRSDIERDWVIEEWCENAIDLNFQLFIRGEEDYDLFLVTKQIIERGVYRGSETIVLSSNKMEEYLDQVNILASYLIQIGYRGIISVDSIITSDNVLIPIIEMNTRFSLSTFLVKIFTNHPDKIITSEIVNIYSSGILTYEAILTELTNRSIAYSVLSRKGILITNSATLPKEDYSIAGAYLGRLFVVLIGDTKNEVVELKCKLEQLWYDMQIGIVE